MTKAASVLLLGESGVGKTHYGAQLLKRLMMSDGHLRMHGQATNLEPFEAALDSLSEGRAAGHTATSTYVDSVWPVADEAGHEAELVWPDYGGEQIKAMIDSRRVPGAWRQRVRDADAWLLLLRLQQTRTGDDIFSRPLVDLRRTSTDNTQAQVSDQARLIELLQMLSYAGDTSALPVAERPQFAVLLTCWDELGFAGRPAVALEAHLPMLWSHIRSNWPEPYVMGLSALGRPLSSVERDEDYVARGPERFGYVIEPDGTRSSDLTLPISLVIRGAPTGTTWSRS